jgi:hypothetical protein
MSTCVVQERIEEEEEDLGRLSVVDPEARSVRNVMSDRKSNFWTSRLESKQCQLLFRLSRLI